MRDVTTIRFLKFIYPISSVKTNECEVQNEKAADLDDRIFEFILT